MERRPRVRGGRPADRWVHLATLFYLLSTTEALNFLDRLIYGEWDGKPGDKLTEVLNLTLIACSVFLARKAVWPINRLRRGPILFLSAGGLLLLSALWSVDPSTTLRHGLLYVTVIIGAIGIAETVDLDTFMAILLLVCCASACLSVVLSITDPAVAFTIDGDFRGAFSHKNMLGQAMAAGVIACLYLMRRHRRPRWRYWAALALLMLVCLVSHSATAFVTACVFCAIALYFAMLRRGGLGKLLAVATMFLLLPVLVILMVFPDAGLSLLGKDPTLTGRTELWAYVVKYIAQRPFLGWGYAAFWTLGNPPAVLISRALVWFVPQAHNGVLEALLEIGWLGTMLFIMLLLRNVMLMLQCLRGSRHLVGMVSLMVCVGIMLTGVSESVLMEPFQVSTCLFFITGLMCEKSLRTAPMPRRMAMAPGQPTSLAVP